MAAIPEGYRDLLDGPVTVSLATILPDGQPQVTPVWCDFDGTHIRVNTAAGRQKHKDMVARPRVTVLALDPANPYRYLEVRGTVARIGEEGADDHIDALAQRYLGVERYPYRNPAETRVICYIEPKRVLAQG
jgi:PPOX class probable F420-dependent enzyme